MNSVTHAVGSHLGAAMTALLIWQALNSETDVAWKIVSGSIFGASMILLYSVSATYHAVAYAPAKRVLKKLDHMAIYILIAGSYTPFCLVALRPQNPVLAWSVFGIEWAAALAGCIVKGWTAGRWRIASTLAYIIMGWVAVAAIVPLAHVLHGMGMMWLILGGALYTLGCPFYLAKRIPYTHGVWHLFTLAGSLAHFFCILWHVM